MVLVQDVDLGERTDDGPRRVPGFSVSLPQFEGPFDLLLALIARRRLDVTELALAEVTDEFIAHMRADWDLEHASEFVVVASTLLALKAHRLLPHDPQEEDEDMELLEARDLLFARLLQYRAYKQAAAALAARAGWAARCHPRAVAPPPELAALLPRLVATIGPTDLARLAVGALTRPGDPGVQTVHLHERVPVGEQVALLVERLRRHGVLSFTELTADAGRTAVVVARFLALLLLHRQGSVDLAQEEAMGEIQVTWCAGQDEAAALSGLEIAEEFA
ncbi:segregation and condensation protein A [Actinomyces howellii]|uniref:Segregation and condensation protein A n=1 Tax=Actinomyces howellii TaxID=52771 RepID=A0A3S5EGW8_9ACTO|nr:ScpA family protein [Actinomyces howellii]VEG26224.1 Segregation and condensation protein A [Actinomyces howellii]